MNNENYTTSFTVDQSPEVVYNAINNVRDWWQGDIEGGTDKLDDAFTYKVKAIHRSTQTITELVPNKKIVWHVSDSDLSFTEAKNEWDGTDIVFDIAEKDGKTEVTFTHVGLKPQRECYNSCTDAWHYYIDGSLRKYIESK